MALHQIVALQRPQLPSDDVTRMAAENTVIVFDGRLVGFKLENGRTGDNDYHLIVTDDTLTPGGSGPASPHCVIAEVVQPECVPGRHGDPSTTSHFQSQIDAVRAAFEAHFPNITGGWNEAGGIPVRVTGIAQPADEDGGHRLPGWNHGPGSRPPSGASGAEEYR